MNNDENKGMKIVLVLLFVLIVLALSFGIVFKLFINKPNSNNGDATTKKVVQHDRHGKKLTLYRDSSAEGSTAYIVADLKYRDKSKYSEFTITCETDNCEYESLPIPENGMFVIKEDNYYSVYSVDDELIKKDVFIYDDITLGESVLRKDAQGDILLVSYVNNPYKYYMDYEYEYEYESKGQNRDKVYKNAKNIIYNLTKNTVSEEFSNIYRRSNIIFSDYVKTILFTDSYDENKNYLYDPSTQSLIHEFNGELVEVNGTSEKINSFSRYLILKNNNKAQLYDYDGNLIIDNKENITYGHILKVNGHDVYFGGNFIYTFSDKKVEVLDFDLNKIAEYDGIDYLYESAEGYSAVKKNKDLVLVDNKFQDVATIIKNFNDVKSEVISINDYGSNGIEVRIKNKNNEKNGTCYVYDFDKKELTSEACDVYYY